jgi:hypothetical protein
VTGGTTSSLKGHTPYNHRRAVSVTVHDPSLFTATVMQETLARNGSRSRRPIPVRDRKLRARC